MAGQAVVAPLVLVGPLIVRLTDDRLTLLLVTTAPLDARKLRAEVWDPLPDALAGWVEPGGVIGALGGLERPTDLEIRPVGKSLYVQRLVLRSKEPSWRRNRALAYRVAPTGSDWLPAPGGAEVLPGAPEKMMPKGKPPSKDPFPWPWFVHDPAGERWAVFGIAASEMGTWREAAGYLGNLCRGSRTRKPGDKNLAGANTEVGRPTAALLFDADAPTIDPAAVGALMKALASKVEPFLAAALCKHVLAFAPNVWDYLAEIAGTKRPATPPPAVLAARSLARIASHVPVYAVPTAGLFASTSADGPQTLVVEANRRTLALLFGWGNRGEHPQVPDVGTFSAATTYTIGAAPEILVSYSLRANLPHPREQSRTGDFVLPFLAVAAPTPALPLARPTAYKPPTLGKYDNLFALSVDNVAYLAVPEEQVDEKEASSLSKTERAKLQRNPRAYGTLAQHRIYQLSLSGTSGASIAKGARDGVNVSWNAKTMRYGWAGKAVVAASTPAFLVFASHIGATHPGYELSVFVDAVRGMGVQLTRLGHRVMPRADAELYIGNRFRPKPEDDGKLLDGIEVSIGGFKELTKASGLADGLLNKLKDGTYTLSVGGPKTQASPPGPTTPSNPNELRIWRQRTFTVVVRSKRIVQVDDEPVVSAGVRLLIDPVYMRLVCGVRQGNAKRPGKVSLFIVHRPEQGDTRASIAKWQTPKGSVTAAAYVLARDGTLIKQAPDDVIVNHAPGHWATTAAAFENTQEQSVGVEITKWHDETGPYTEAQYLHLLWLFGQYVQNGLAPVAVVGHGDVKDVGKDDPGLCFEWSRFEELGFGLCRMQNKSVVSPNRGPYPDFHKKLDLADDDEQKFRDASPALQRAMRADIGEFDKIFKNELQQKNAVQAVDDRVQKLLFAIGYRQAGEPKVVADLKADEQAAIALAQKNGTRVKGDFTASRPERAFRTHFFGGDRRTYFKLRAAGGEPDTRQDQDEQLGPDTVKGKAPGQKPVQVFVKGGGLDHAGLRKLSAVWAYQVAEYVANAPQSVGSLPSEPPPPR